MRGGVIAGSRRRSSVVTPANVLTNGDFSGADTGWSGFYYSGKAPTAGKAVFTSSPSFDGIWQAVTLTPGKYYQLTWTISGRGATTTVYPRFTGGTTRNGTPRTANGTFTERLLANAGNTTFEFLLDDPGGSVTVDDISLVGPYNTATVGGA